MEDEVDEYETVKYFCTPSCENVAVEVPRETGRRYFTAKPTVATPDDAVPSGRYFVGIATDRVAVERERETGEREFGPPDVTLVGYDSNLSDLRTETGCIYYSGEPCIDVVTADRTVKPPPPPEKYFCPGVCDHMPPETPRETGIMYFGAPASPSSSAAGSLADELAEAATEEFAFNLQDVRDKTGYWYYGGKMWDGYPPVRYAAITSKIKHAIKLKTSPERLCTTVAALLAFCFCLQPMTTAANDGVVIGCKLKQNANDGCNSCATAVQFLRDLFYVLLYVLLPVPDRSEDGVGLLFSIDFFVCLFVCLYVSLFLC